MRKFLCSAAVAALTAAVAPAALGQHVPIPDANYTNAITSRLAGGSPAGWTFGWSSDGALDGSYTPLAADNGRLETVANGAYPDAAPGSLLTLGSGSTSPTYTYNIATAVAGNFGIASLPQSFVRPGDAVGGVDRPAVIGYTFTGADLGGGPSKVFIESFSFGVSDQSSSGIRTQVFKNGEPTALFANLFNAGDYFDSQFPQAIGGGPFDVGTFSPGDTIYFTFGSNGTADGDEMRFTFTLAAAPEPGAVGLLLLGGLAGALKRRRRVC